MHNGDSGFGKKAGSVVMAIVAILTLTAGWVSAQEGPIELRLKLIKGETLHYSYSSSFQQFREGVSQPGSTDQYAARRTIRVLDVDVSGIATVEEIDEEVRVTDESGQTHQPLDRTRILRVRPDSTVIETLGGLKLDYFSYALPPQAVRPGESWTRRGDFTIRGNRNRRGDTPAGRLMAGSEQRLSMTATFRLVGVDRVLDERVARIDYRLEGRSETATTGTLSSQSRDSIQVTGQILWSVDRGRPARATGEERVQSEIDIIVQGGVLRAKTRSSTSTQEEFLPPDRITIPRVAEDRLIVPGKGIGAFGLDVSVDNLTAKLGSPEARGEADLVFNARSVRWPNMLIGFLDGDDRSKLVGIEIADKTFRTAKGIGFGSSRGAVLFAYGMSPTTIEMTIPQLGTVPVLIYNDLGIAFTIAREGQRGQSPPGTVTLVTAFLPGAGRKIFPP